MNRCQLSEHPFGEISLNRKFYRRKLSIVFRYICDFCTSFELCIGSYIGTCLSFSGSSRICIYICLSDSVSCECKDLKCSTFYYLYNPNYSLDLYYSLFPFPERKIRKSSFSSGYRNTGNDYTFWTCCT
jgi:hypothetical protein